MRLHTPRITGSLAVSSSILTIDTLGSVSGSNTSTGSFGSVYGLNLNDAGMSITSVSSVSSSIATRFDSREGDMTLATASIAAITASISRLNTEISTDDTDMNLATASIAAITASISRIDSEIDTNSANMTLATASIAAITSSISTINDNMTLATASIAAITSSIADNLDQAVKTDSDVTFGTVSSGDITSTGTITAVEVHTTFVSSSIAVISGSNIFGDAKSDLHQFTGSVDVSGSFTLRAGDMTVSDTLTATNIGAFTAAGAIDFGDQNMTNVDIDSGDITGVTFGTAASTTISGSTTAVSSSIATRFDSRETDMTLATASIAAITSSIGGIVGGHALLISGSVFSTGSFGQLKTGDLELENERGHWAIIEEEEYLSITNVKTNKKYKFVLEEIE